MIMDNGATGQMLDSGAAADGSAAGGMSGLWPLMAISALSQYEKAKKDDEQSQRDWRLKANTAALKPWTGESSMNVHPGPSVNPFNAALGGAVQGAGMSQAVGNMNSKNPWSEIANQIALNNYSKSMNPGSA